MSRVVAADLANVNPRTITRWANNGVLIKYAGPRGDVQFDRAAVEKMRKAVTDRQSVASPQDRAQHLRDQEPEPEEIEPEPAPVLRPRW